ncbi:MAG TPA: metallophosphoesterase [Candidatus Acidoferrales bacterium]|nr:metallophosphoesterase [Candidatus Acidoferrales bacterium]
MKIQIFSDIHGDLRSLEKLLSVPADIYISAGDLSTFGKGLDACAPILSKQASRVWALPGNHETAAQNQEFCAAADFTDFHQQIRQIGSTNWAGLGYSNPTPFDTPGEYSEEQIAEALDAFRNLAPLYLVVHAPPYGSKLDEFAPGKHAGSRAVREWVEREQPEMLFCGHIHECGGKSDRIGRTRCFNVGKRGYLLDLKTSQE